MGAMGESRYVERNAVGDLQIIELLLFGEREEIEAAGFEMDEDREGGVRSIRREVRRESCRERPQDRPEDRPPQQGMKG